MSPVNNETKLLVDDNENKNWEKKNMFSKKIGSMINKTKSGGCKKNDR